MDEIVDMSILRNKRETYEKLRSQYKTLAKFPDKLTALKTTKDYFVLANEIFNIDTSVNELMDIVDVSTDIKKLAKIYLVNFYEVEIGEICNEIDVDKLSMEEIKILFSKYPSKLIVCIIKQLSKDNNEKARELCEYFKTHIFTDLSVKKIGNKSNTIMDIDAIPITEYMNIDELGKMHNMDIKKCEDLRVKFDVYVIYRGCNTIDYNYKNISSVKTSGISKEIIRNFTTQRVIKADGERQKFGQYEVVHVKCTSKYCSGTLYVEISGKMCRLLKCKGFLLSERIQGYNMCAGDLVKKSLKRPIVMPEESVNYFTATIDVINKIIGEVNDCFVKYSQNDTNKNKDIVELYYNFMGSDEIRAAVAEQLTDFYYDFYLLTTSTFINTELMASFLPDLSAFKNRFSQMLVDYTLSTPLPKNCNEYEMVAHMEIVIREILNALITKRSNPFTHLGKKIMFLEMMNLYNFTTHLGIK